MVSAEHVFEFLQSSQWVRVGTFTDVRFLAAGEYNENYLVEAESGRFVFRINHGSQLGLGKQQLQYEFDVLTALEGSGVTPRPFFLAQDAPGLGQVMLMEYLEGEPLRYDRDLEEAACILARVHARPVSDKLLVQAEPVADIAAESLSLLGRFPDHPMQREKERLLAYHEEIMDLYRRTRDELSCEPLCIVNTEVNSGNFIIGSGKGRAWLVDWEKAVVSSRYQDLGHFLVPTTTLWKTNHRITPRQREDFLAAYRAEAGLSLSLADLSRRTAILERTILLRAMAWCHMAHYEYTRSNRALAHDQTFGRINWYLEEMECFLS